MQAITNISVDILKVHPRNTEFFDDISGEEYERFKKSIETDGLLSPLVVAPDMTIISGHQRLKACRELGYKTVPVIIQESIEDDDDKLRKLIAANFGRLKNDPIKQSKLITEYEKLCGVRRGSAGKRSLEPNNSVPKQSDIAKQLGVTVDTLQNLKRLQTLSPDLQEIISSGQLTPTTGFKILAKLSESEQQQLLSMLPAAKKLTQAQVQEYVDQLHAKDNVIAGYKAKLESKSESNDDKIQTLKMQIQMKDEKLAKYESQKQMLEKKAALNGEDAERYKKLKSDIEFLTKQKDDIGRQIDSARELAELTAEVQDLLERKLAPVKFKRCMDIIGNSAVAVGNLQEVIDKLNNWIHEVESYMPNGNVIFVNN